MTSVQLEQKLGYPFRQRALLNEALTHRSFGIPNYERLEFLGDGVLNCVMAQMLLARFPAMPEGDLSRVRSTLVNQGTLCDIAHSLGLNRLLRLGDGEIKTGGAERPSILADAVEALFGAVFSDGGYSEALRIIGAIYRPYLDTVAQSGPAKDAKTQLQEWLQAQRLPLPKYVVDRIEGEAHKQQFYVSCNIEGRNLQAAGSGSSRRIAEQEAAALILAAINGASR